MGFDIEWAMLTDEEADRLYTTRPELDAGPDEYCPTCRKRDKCTYRWRGETVECNCRRQLQLAKHYSAAGIGATYQRLDWPDYAVNDVLLASLLRYLDRHEAHIGNGMGLLFWGAIGTGKTMAANLVLKELIKLGYSGFATTFAGTVEAFTSTWGSRENKEWFARKFMHSQVLLLDDLGKELRVGNNLPQSTFDMILRTRVEEGRPTLLTTNCTLAELESGYGSAVLSLLKEQSVTYHFTGDDFRPSANARTRAEIESGEVRPIV